VRVEVEAGEGGGGGAEPPHGGGRGDAAAHDVADDEGDPAVVEGDHVVPVAPHLAAGLGRAVAGGEFQAGVGRRELGQEAALQGLGGAAQPLVEAGVVDGHRGAGGQFAGE